MSTKRYQVVSCTKEHLVALFSGSSIVEGISSNRRTEYISNKAQVNYLLAYCGARGITTLVYEEEYVDSNYSQDYWGYYVRCFVQYPKRCARVHFFTAAFSDEALMGLLTDEQAHEAAFEGLGYSGFVVVKPLPETIIGRTCVAAPDAHAAQFPTLQRQPALLFGVPLKVDTLPFQEQDHEVAACATSALWTCLQGTARQFNHPLLSPLEITRKAYSFPSLGRALPNDGLTMSQMAGVAREIGLEADLVDVSEHYLLQACSYAYMRCGIPLLLGFDFNLVDDDDPQLHAVALVGYEMSRSDPTPITQCDFLLRATRINRFYTHDDGVGPFAPLDLSRSARRLKTFWTDRSGQRIEARSDQLLVPLYPQIRTHFIGVLEAIIGFDFLIEQLRLMKGRLSVEGRMEWDVFLTDVRSLKQSVLRDAVSSEEKIDVLTRSFPQFVWRAIAYEGEVRKLDLLMDATNLLQGRQLIHSICHDRKFESGITRELREVDFVPFVSASLTKDIIEHFEAK